MGWPERAVFAVVAGLVGPGLVVAAASGLGDVAHTGRGAVRVDPPPRSVSVIAGGDVLTEARVRRAAAAHGESSGVRFDFAPVFAPVASAVSSADLAICHMELPIGRPGADYGNFGRSDYGGNRLLSPFEIAGGLAATGFDACSTASNHSYDLGADGVASTIEALAANGIAATGTARTATEAAPRRFVIDGVTIAHVAFTVWSNTVRPTDPWRVNISRDPTVIAAQVERARRDGADIVVLSVHVTQELRTAPTEADRDLVTSVVRGSSVDAVFVHGPHVVQPFEVVGGVPVWWSLGNFVSEMGPPSVGRYSEPRTSDGLLGFVRFTQRPDGGFDTEAGTVAICNDRGDRTVRAPVLDRFRSDLPPTIRDDLQACLARTLAVVPDAR